MHRYASVAQRSSRMRETNHVTQRNVCLRDAPGHQARRLCQRKLADPDRRAERPAARASQGGLHARRRVRPRASRATASEAAGFARDGERGSGLRARRRARRRGAAPSVWVSRAPRGGGNSPPPRARAPKPEPAVCRSRERARSSSAARRCSLPPPSAVVWQNVLVKHSATVASATTRGSAAWRKGRLMAKGGGQRARTPTTRLAEGAAARPRVTERGGDARPTHICYARHGRGHGALHELRVSVHRGAARSDGLRVVANHHRPSEAARAVLKGGGN